jgi:hypothetical protein
MLDFERNNLEVVEREYWRRLSPAFRAYKEFWEELVGQRIVDAYTLAPYDVCSNGKVDDELREEFADKLRIIGQNSYTIFFRLASVSEDISLAEKSLSVAEPGRKLVLHFGALESVYMKLGSCLEIVDCSMLGVFKRRFLPSNYHELESSPEKFWASARIDRGRFELRIGKFRHYMAHFAKIGHRIENGRFKIVKEWNPEWAKRNPRWENFRDPNLEFVDTVEKATCDFEFAQCFLNRVLLGLLPIYRSMLEFTHTNYGIWLDRDSLPPGTAVSGKGNFSSSS